MANPGVGTKFVSVNLNKSYGHSNPHHHHSDSYGTNRTRPGSHGGGGSGGMLVLSRPRSSHKPGPKLAVPPPLNLPSLRKEHERFDSSGSSGGSAGGGVSGSGSRPSSSAVGWTKPGPTALQAKEGINSDNSADGIDQGLPSIDAVNRGSSMYMPPTAHSGAGRISVSAATQVHHPPPVAKVSVLRGEDFPSLRAALPSASVTPQKQKDGLAMKQKQLISKDYPNEQRDGSYSSPLVDMHPQLQLSRQNVGNGVNEKGGQSNKTTRTLEKSWKQEEFFAGPLPLVRLKPRSDWADDERDTGHGLTDRGRDTGVSRSESYWDTTFDVPRVSVLPHKPANHNIYDKRGQHDDKMGRVTSSEVLKVEPYVRDDVKAHSREGRGSPLPKGGFVAQEVGYDRKSVDARPSSLSRDLGKNDKYTPSTSHENAHENFGRRDLGYGQGGRQAWNNTNNSFSSRGGERNTRDRYGNEQFNRYRDDAFQSNSASKSSFSSGGQRLPISDPILNFGREKRSFSKSGKSYLEDPFMKDFGASGFDGRDPFSGGIAGLVKRKKDVVKQTDFHDPARESFEAELERVQKMQEEERQRIVEEQERALELARREEEDRARLAREQEERQRRLEDEAREAAWRVKQEQLEATRKAEELRIAREEEKRRIFMEEERRKQAAQQKLLELEERMAKRKVESANTGGNSSATAEEKLSRMVNEKDVSRIADMSDWEDGERMVERLTTSVPYDSSSLIRSFDMEPRSHFAREGSIFMDREKPVSSWRRDFFDNGNSSNILLQEQEISHHSPRRDASVGGRPFSKKDFYGGPSFVSSKTQQKGGVPDMHMDDSAHVKGQRWNLSGDEDNFNRNSEFDSNFQENLAERFGDVGWGKGRWRGNSYSHYPECEYQNSDADGVYPAGRSRYVMRQPRVLPPPSLASVHKNHRTNLERPGPSTFVDDEMQYNHVARREPILQTGFDGGHQGHLERSGVLDVHEQNSFGTGEQKLDRRSTPRCDSQSSLCVSSPPSSPTHLSHDDLDESGDCLMPSAGQQNKDIPQSGNETVVLRTNTGIENSASAPNSASPCDDEEWMVDNDEHLQEQEEYDEDEDGYEEEDEVHEGDDTNIALTHDFEALNFEEKGLPEVIVNNVVLGFNEGVEVVMPSDEFESSSRNEEGAFGKPHVSSQEEHGSSDEEQGDEKSIKPLDAIPQVTVDSSSGILQETENKMQELVIQPNKAPQLSAASETSNNLDASGSCGLVAQHPVAMASYPTSGQTVMPTGPVVPSQAEAPIKLQFGLFSGPSLIPSPVPAIQIGSIQMPLHLHPQVGSSLAHRHPSQPPLFQFGQLRYTSPISQGVLPLDPQSRSFLHPNMSLNQNQGHTLPIQTSQDISGHNVMKNNSVSVSMDSQPSPVTKSLNLSQGSMSQELNSVPSRGSAENTMIPQGQLEDSPTDYNNVTFISSGQVKDQGQLNAAEKYKSLSSSGVSDGQTKTGAAPSPLVSKEKDPNLSKVHRPISGPRGKKHIYAVRGSGSRSSFPAADASNLDSGGFHRRPRQNVHRTEFRIRESFGLDGQSKFSRDTGMSGRGYSSKVIAPSKISKQTTESDSFGSGSVSSEIRSGIRPGKGAIKESLAKSQNVQHLKEVNHKRNIHSGEDVDVPLQSGVVRVFEQPGIEAPSDEDDFIEVRSKRQMLNDRREQREKEIKAKSRVTKMSRKPRSSSQSVVPRSNSNKISASRGGAANSLCSDFVSTDGLGSENIGTSAALKSSIPSQPLAPIGTPAAKNDAQPNLVSQPIKSIQQSPLPAAAGGQKLVPGVISESNNKILDNAQTSLGSWGNSANNQQVMALTQTQLDEAMKPIKFDSRVAVGDHTRSSSEPSLSSSSVIAKDKSFSSAASPINSLLAGEKIQFGAVTSPTILPSSGHSASQRIGSRGPCHPDLHVSQNLSATELNCSLFFDKEKHLNKSCGHLEDCEAEAAASAVAVAAITSDEIVENGTATSSISVSDTKSFVHAEMDGIPAGGVSRDEHLVSQSRAEESLSVTLPADLSVEMQPISLWPPLPSPQNSSVQMLSHFPGGPPSHFPFYEMNPMLGGPIFAFGPHDESASNQSHSQKTSTPVSGPLGTWQQCHSGVDSFYGPPAGFAGPFISPPGGVQGPPHMVVYNHFAPVGQYGQVGLSYAYIPSGKQSDWKQNHTSSSLGVGEGDMDNLNRAASTQWNPTSMPPIQHLAPGSPLLPMASPLAMFDVSPFQSSPDMARWSHVPVSHLQPVPLSMAMQQPAEGVVSSHGPVEQSLTANRLPESRASTSSEGSHSFHVPTAATSTKLPEEIRVVDPSSSSSPSVTKSPSVGTIRDTGKIQPVQNAAVNNSGQNSNSGFRHQKNGSGHQYSQSSGNNYQRGGWGGSQKNSPGGESSHKRMGRNQSSGAERNFPPSKMKQVYVAKQTTNGSSTAP